MAVFAVLFFIFEGIAGCAAGTASSSVLKEDIAKNPSQGHYIENIPFIAQEEFYCGPASLAMVLNFYGIKIAQEEIAKEIYLKKLKGALNIDLVTYARQKGLQTRYYSGSLEDLKTNISNNTPLILLLNVGYESFPAYHYMVVTGFHHENSLIIAHSGKEKDKVFSYRELLAAWEKTSFGTLLITPLERK